MASNVLSGFGQNFDGFQKLLVNNTAGIAIQAKDKGSSSGFLLALFLPFLVTLAIPALLYTAKAALIAMGLYPG